MANHKSAEKRIKQTATKTQRNRYYKTKVKNITRAFYEAVDKNDKDEASKIFKTINKNFHKYATKGVYKKETISRKVSRLNIHLNKIK